jgi:hypothetical protein
MDFNAVSILSVAILGLLASGVLSRVRQYWRLRQFDGPGAFSWWWHSKAVISGAAHEHYGAVTEQYGKKTFDYDMSVVQNASQLRHSGTWYTTALCSGRCA